MHGILKYIYLINYILKQNEIWISINTVSDFLSKLLQFPQEKKTQLFS